MKLRLQSSPLACASCPSDGFAAGAALAAVALRAAAADGGTARRAPACRAVRDARAGDADSAEGRGRSMRFAELELPACRTDFGGEDLPAAAERVARTAEPTTMICEVARERRLSATAS